MPYLAGHGARQALGLGERRGGQEHGDLVVGPARQQVGLAHGLRDHRADGAHQRTCGLQSDTCGQIGVARHGEHEQRERQAGSLGPLHFLRQAPVEVAPSIEAAHRIDLGFVKRAPG